MGQPLRAAKDVVQITSSAFAFAALHRTGKVSCWGRPLFGGDSTAIADQLDGVRVIYGNRSAFTALTTDGRVVTWGEPNGGGDRSAAQERLDGQVSYQAPASELNKAHLSLLRRKALAGSATS